MRRPRTSRAPTALVACVLLLGAAGCNNGRYPVSGRVHYADGTPVNEGVVIGETEDTQRKVMAQGEIRRDGTFRWGTERPGDGALPGKYRVAVLPRALGDAETAKGMLPAVDHKFTDFRTSGLEFEVTSGRNEFNIKVTKPAPRTR